MSQPLRRSRRVRKPSTYNIGDIVKVLRSSGATSNGRLLYRLSEGQLPSANLWLVAFDDDTGARDEEIYETRFGNLVQRAGDSDEDGSKKAANDASVASASKVKEGGQVMSARKGKQESASDKKATDSSTGGNEESANKQPLTTKQKDAGSESPLPSPSVISDCSSSASASAAKQQQQQDEEGEQQQESSPKVSAREQRRLRRQAAIDEQMPSRSADSSQRQKGQAGGKRSMAHLQRGPNSKKAKKEKEEVITVQLNTGVLYLYRGINRRAVFVRKY